MRRLIAAAAAATMSTGVLLSLSAAHAQSLPGVGPYVGLNAGYSWGDSQQRDQVIPVPPPRPPQGPADGNYNVDGASLGIGAGYGFLANGLLFGIEGDINWADVEGSSSVCGGTHACGTKLEGYGTLRGRLGVPVGASTLAYVTGGLAVGRITAFDSTAPGFEGTKTKAGWTVGAGLEHKWSDRWSLKLEYLYMDFGKDDYFTLPFHTPESVDLAVHTVRIGLNYSFDAPAPVTYQPLK